MEALFLFGIYPNRTWLEGSGSIAAFTIAKKHQNWKQINFPPQRTLLPKGFGWVAIQHRHAHSDSGHVNNRARGPRKTASGASFSAPNPARWERGTLVAIQSSSHVNTLALMWSIWNVSTALASQRGSSFLNKWRQNRSLLTRAGDTERLSSHLCCDLKVRTDDFIYISVTDAGWDTTK